MSDFAARISRVRMKSGGADVHVLVNPMPEGEKDFRASVMDSARAVVEMSGDSPLVGYFFIGIHSDGKHSASYRIDNEKCPIPATLLPAYITEIIRRYAVTDTEARDVFNEMFQWVE